MNRLRSSSSGKISFFAFQDIITSVTGILILVTLILSFSLKTGAPEVAGETTPQKEIKTLQEELARTEEANAAAQRVRLEAAASPDPAQIQTQIESLRTERAARSQQLTQSEQTRQQADARVRQEKAEQTVKEQLMKEIQTFEEQVGQLRGRLAEARTNQNALMIIPEGVSATDARQPVFFVVNSAGVEARRMDNSSVGGKIALSADAAPFTQLLRQFNPAREIAILYFRPSGIKWFAPLRDAARQAGFELGYDAVEEEKELVFAPR